MIKKKGRQTVEFTDPVYILSHAAIGGKKEGEGPLKDDFDMIVSDDKMGQKTWELAESSFLRTAVEHAIKSAKLTTADIDYVLAGDLQNQCAATHYAIRDFPIPYFGLYGACSTMCESLSLGSVLISSGAANRVLCATSSHYCSAEKQYRSPLEYGGQRAPAAQWTVTGSGAVILSTEHAKCKITHITTGRIVDKGITDSANMGAAMAPAAMDTILAHFNDTGRTPDYYDLIVTGDLGRVGTDILCDLMLREKTDINSRHRDCGLLVYDRMRQDVHSGGSGCGCIASVFSGYLIKAIENGKYNRILLTATGALMNPLTVSEGESIPVIAHAVAIERSEI